MEILLNIYLFFILSASICFSTPDPDGKRQQISCVWSCRDFRSGIYVALCRSCVHYCHGPQEKHCNRGKEWDSDRERCVSSPSPTCIQGTTTTSTTTTIKTTTSTQNSQEQHSKEKNSASEYVNNTSSDHRRVHESDSTGFINPPDRVDNEDKLPTDTATHGDYPRHPYPPKPFPEIPCFNGSRSDFLLKWIPCQYMLLLSGLIGLLPIIICLICQMCRHKRKIKRKMLVEMNRTSVSTQTMAVNPYTMPIDSDSAIYDDLLPFDADVNRYTPLPYTISNPGHYSNISLSNFDSVNHNNTYDYGNNSANDYLELLPSYSYLQMQDDQTRKEVGHTLAPLIIDLCEKYKSNPEKYKELEGKIGRCLENYYNIV